MIEQEEARSKTKAALDIMCGKELKEIQSLIDSATSQGSLGITIGDVSEKYPNYPQVRNALKCHGYSVEYNVICDTWNIFW